MQERELALDRERHDMQLAANEGRPGALRRDAMSGKPDNIYWNNTKVGTRPLLFRKYRTCMCPLRLHSFRATVCSAALLVAVPLSPLSAGIRGACAAVGFPKEAHRMGADRSAPIFQPIVCFLKGTSPLS